MNEPVQWRNLAADKFWKQTKRLVTGLMVLLLVFGVMTYAVLTGPARLSRTEPVQVQE